MKVSVITGASGGIGTELAALYLADDYMVFGIDKEKQEKINNERYFHINGDLYLFSKDKKYRESIIGNLEENLPKDIEKFVIVNNAAKQILKPVQKLQWRDWEESLSVNSITPFFMARDLINIFNSSDGHIINISSIHAKLTKSNFTAYSASKAALESITRSLAIELSSLGISINCIAPAAIMTNMLKSSFINNPEGLKELENYHPTKKIASPHELALFVKSISDSKGGFLTGSVIDFSGGINNVLNDPENAN